MSQGNPLFNEKAFEQTLSRGRVGEAMTLQGTVNKTFALLFLCVVAGMFAWKNYQALAGYTTMIAIATFIVAMIVIFRKTSAPILAPVYAVGEGLVLGIISAAYNSAYQGIVGQAITITLLVFGLMLFLYKTGIIKVTRGFVIGVTAATGAIALFYLGSIVVGLFGVQVPYFTSTSGVSIAVNVFICIIAALNFAIDFQFIDQLTSQITAPKYMEWYAGFSLMVTLVWLYLEILRLLARTRDR
ncbi:MAG: Bax inhibitor-1/YccA family protein [Elusimicrobiaceae bacterium]|nr:Bax inhibitor-1/YccA family protein [Elusimicrobiaceae bacterium]